MNTTEVIGLGTAAIGRPQYINIKQHSEDLSLEEFKLQGIAVLDKAYDTGIRYFDTAPGYGMAESLLLNWLKERQYSDVEIATKWGYTYVADFKKEATVHEVKDHSFEKLLEQWSVSECFQKNLKLYQIHSAGFDTNVLTDTRVHQKLYDIKKKTGVLIGLTSSGAEQTKTIKKALSIKVEGESLFDAFQVTYNMLDQSLLEVIDELNEKRKKVIVKEALANGRIFPNENYLHYSSLYKKMNELSVKYNVEVDAVALRFVIDSVKPFKVLSGASTCDQLIQNLKTIQFKLSVDELDQLKEFGIKPEAYWSERKKLEWV